MRNRWSVYCLTVIASSLAVAHAAPFPVRTSSQAIAIAKSVCLKHARIFDKSGKEEDIKRIFPSLDWVADEHKRVWHVRSNVTCTQPHMLNVDVPAGGPYPTRCDESLYFLPGMQCPGEPKP